MVVMANYTNELSNFPSADTWYTAKEIDLSSATLRAMERRQLVEVDRTTSPHRYRMKGIGVHQKVIQLAQELDTDLISLKRSSEPLGMMCQVKQGLIYDCWGNQYDVTGVDLYWSKEKSDWVKIIA